MTDFDQALLDLLKQAGLPESCEKITLFIEVNKITKVECKFYPKLNGEYIIDEGLLITETRLFEIKEID